MGNRNYSQMRDKENSPLKQAQTLKMTRSGLPISQQQSTKLMTRRQLEKMKKSANVSPDVRIILNPPFSDVDRITDNLYLTGVAGLIEENIISLKITCIINATFEMPLLQIKGIDSYRVPVIDSHSFTIHQSFNSYVDRWTMMLVKRSYSTLMTFPMWYMKPRKKEEEQ